MLSLHNGRAKAKRDQSDNRMSMLMPDNAEELWLATIRKAGQKGGDGMRALMNHQQ